MSRGRRIGFGLITIGVCSVGTLAIREERIPSGPSDLRFLEDGRVLVAADREVIELAPDGTWRSSTVIPMLGRWSALDRFATSTDGVVVCDDERKAHAFPPRNGPPPMTICDSGRRPERITVEHDGDLYTLDRWAMRIQRRSGSPFGDAQLEHRFAALRDASNRIGAVQAVRATVPMLGLMAAIFGFLILLATKGESYSLEHRLRLQPLVLDPAHARAQRRRLAIGIALFAGGLAAVLLSRTFAADRKAFDTVFLASLVAMFAGELLSLSQLTSTFARQESRRFLASHGRAIDRILEPGEVIHVLSRAQGHLTLGGYILLTDRRLLLLRAPIFRWQEPKIVESVPLGAARSVRRVAHALNDRLLGKRFLEIGGGEGQRARKLMLAGEEESAAIAGAFENAAGALSLARSVDERGRISHTGGDPDGGLSRVD